MQERIDRYEIIAEISKGGQGIVYLAEDTTSPDNLQVALKVLNKRASESDEYVKAFEREAAFVKGLNHPNIVNIIGFGIDRKQDKAYIAMELLDHDLKSLVKTMI